MLSSNPAVPISSINFADNDRKRLALVTHHGREMFTAHDGLPSPEHLTPMSGMTPAGGNTPVHGMTPMGTPPDSESPSLSSSRRESTTELNGDDGNSLKKVASRRDEVSLSFASRVLLSDGYLLLGFALYLVWHTHPSSLRHRFVSLHTILHSYSPSLVVKKASCKGGFDDHCHKKWC